MTEHANIELASRLLAVFETGEDEAVEQLIHASHRDHVVFDGSNGPDSVRAAIRSWRAGFTALRIVPEDIIASGDRVVVRVHISGSRAAGFDGGDVTDVELEEIHIWRVADERLVEHWMVRGREA